MFLLAQVRGRLTVCTFSLSGLFETLDCWIDFHVLDGAVFILNFGPTFQLMM